MITHTTGQYVISGGNRSEWIGTAATTLRGAKNIASKVYQQSPGGKIEVARVYDYGHDGCYVRVAIKHGYDRWQSE